MNPVYRNRVLTLVGVVGLVPSAAIAADRWREAGADVWFLAACGACAAFAGLLAFCMGWVLCHERLWMRVVWFALLSIAMTSAMTQALIGTFPRRHSSGTETPK